MRATIKALCMTGWRDSSGGYLTGDESESVFDSDNEAVDQYDDELDAGAGQVSTDALWRRWRALDDEYARLNSSPPVDSAASFKPDDLSPVERERRIAELIHELGEVEWELEANGEDIGLPPPAQEAAAPPEPAVAVGETRRRQSKAPKPADILRSRLTDAEFEHWTLVDQGVRQVDIAKALGISQPAVSSRERRLRDRINQIYMEATGSPYHWTPIPERGRPRRR